MWNNLEGCGRNWTWPLLGCYSCIYKNVYRRESVLMCFRICRITEMSVECWIFQYNPDTMHQSCNWKSDTQLPKNTGILELKVTTLLIILAKFTICIWRPDYKPDFSLEIHWCLKGAVHRLTELLNIFYYAIVLAHSMNRSFICFEDVLPQNMQQLSSKSCSVTAIKQW